VAELGVPAHLHNAGVFVALLLAIRIDILFAADDTLNPDEACSWS
jgi:hypothetical protein